MNLYCAIMIPTIESRIIGGVGIIRGRGLDIAIIINNRGVGIIVCVGGGQSGWTGLNK